MTESVCTYVLGVYESYLVKEKAPRCTYNIQKNNFFSRQRFESRRVIIIFGK